MKMMQLLILLTAYERARSAPMLREAFWIEVVAVD